MAFKIKDGVRVGTTDVFNNSGALLVAAPSVTNSLTAGSGLTGGPYNGSAAVTIAHSNSVTAGTASEGGVTRTLSPGGTFNIPSVTYDANGHITGKGSITLTLPSAGATPNNGTLTVSISGTAANSGTAVTWGTTTGFSADTASNVTYDLRLGPSITALATTMSGATTGFLKKTGADTYTLDTNTYLTSYTETDTLATVTGRGATTATAVSFTNSTASSSTSTGAVVVTGGVGIGGALNVGGAAAVTGNLTITGNLIVNGTTTTVNSTTVTLDDPILTLGGDTAPGTDDSKDRGIEFRWHNGTNAKVGFFGFDDSTGYLTFIPDATNTSEVFSGTPGDIQATNFRGALIGNADTATSAGKWTTARTLSFTGDVTGSSSVDGSANVATALTLANSGVTIGTYNNVTVDVKGRVTSGSNVSYLTSESDTLATVTGRGATTSTAVSFTNSSASTNTTSGAVVVTGGVGVGGAVNVGGNLTVNGVTRDALSNGVVITDENVVQATVATTTGTVVDSWAIATYRSAKYIVQITQGSNYQVSEILVLHNGTTTTMTEYAVLETSGALGTFTTDVSSGSARLTVTMGSATSATINIQRVLMVV